MRWLLKGLLILSVALLAGPRPQHADTPRGAAAVPPLGAPPSHAIETIGRLPMHFEPNMGQADPSVRFIARGRGYTVLLTSTEAAFTLRGRERSATVAMRWEGANPAPEAAGQTPLAGGVNYFIGNDPRRWRTNIPTYAKVHYRSVYPRIDLVYYGTQRDLEYDFVVAPGGDSRVIKVAFDGVDRLEVDDQGDLILHLAGGTLRQRRPRIYQEAGGIRQEVTGGFVPLGDRQVGFWVGAYDAQRPLVIDPALAYSTYLGGSGADFGAGVAVDASGNVYLTGTTLSSNFPTIAGSLDTTRGGSTDAFITKLNATGTALVYSTYLGGADVENAYGIAIDGVGNAYVAGWTSSADFPTTPGVVGPTYNGGAHDAFVTKLNATGSALVYSTFLGGSNADSAHAIAVDAAGFAYVTGDTDSSGFPTSVGAYDTTSNGGVDTFVSKLNGLGSAFVYSTFLGGASNDFGYGIAVDGPSGNAHVTGYTNSSNFPTTPGALDTAANGSSDVFVTRFNFAGTALVYSTYLGGSGSDIGYGIAVDATGNALVAGQTASPNFPTTPGATDTTLGGADDAFVSKLTPTGSLLAYSTYLGGSGGEAAAAIAVDSGRSAYITGTTTSGDFPTLLPVQPTSGGGQDAFVTKLTPSGVIAYSTYLGGSGTDAGDGIAVNAARAAYVVGDTGSADFPTTPGAFDSSANGNTDVFLARISPSASVGLYDPASSTFYVRNTNSAGPADVAFGYGPAGAGWIPLSGDWNGDGVDTVGVYNPATATFYLRNANSAGPADLTFIYGPGGGIWIPIVGDWDGNGTDTIGLYNFATGTFYLRNTNTAGPADLTFVYGPVGAGWLPIKGDWDGNGTYTVGLYNPATGTFYVRNSNSAGPADGTFGYGPGGLGWVPVIGDWDGNGTHTAGLYDPATGIFYLRNSNSAGPAEMTFGYGPGGLGWVSRSGNWDGE